MLLPSPLDPGILVCVSAAIALGLLAYAAGCALLPPKVAGDDWLTRCATRCVAGLLFIAGIASVFVLQRLSYVVVMPVMQLAFAAWSWKKQGRDGGAMFSCGMDRGGAAALVAVVAGCVAFEWWQTGWVLPDGSIRAIHSDLGYFAMQVRGVIEARSTDLWAATLGAQAGAREGSADVWYHWSPVWLAALITKTTGRMPLAALMHVVAIVLDVLLVIVTGAIVRCLTGMRETRCLLIGAASIVSVQLLRELGLRWFDLSGATDSLQLQRMSLAFAFSYKFEGAVLLLALLSWLRKEPVLAVVLLACAAVSSPHATGCCGVTAGVLGGIGLLMRKKQMWLTAAVMIGIVAGAWGCLEFLLGASLPKAEGKALLVFDIKTMLLAVRAGLSEACTALLLGALSLPGILHLIFSRDERATEDGRILGWMALSGIIGSFIGFRLLGGMADNLHFIMMTHAVLVMPAGIWGLARMVCWCSGAARWTGVTLIVVSAAMGAVDLVQRRSTSDRTPWKESDLAGLKQALHGRPFGYVAKKDRSWWIPWHSTLAAMLDCRCIRLHEIRAPGAAQENTAASYYGGRRPFALVPPVWGKEDEITWALRFARHAGIECFLEFGTDKLPAEIKSRCREVSRIPLITLYELMPDQQGQ